MRHRNKLVFMQYLFHSALEGIMVAIIMELFRLSISSGSIQSDLKFVGMDSLSLFLGPGLFSALYLGTLVWLTPKWSWISFLLAIVPSISAMGSFFVNIDGFCLVPIYLTTMWIIVTLLAVRFQFAIYHGEQIPIEK